jgi:hypothetical protein
VAHVDRAALAAGFAVAEDVLVLRDDELRLRVFARRAQDEFVDKGIEEVPQARGFVRAVDNVAFRLVVEGRLRAQLASKELRRV